MFDFVKMEEDILKQWNDMDIFKLVQDSTKGRPVYTFLEGPPTAISMS